MQGSIRAIIRHLQARRRCNLADHSVEQLHHGARVRVRRRIYELLHFQDNFPPLSRPTRREGTPLGDSRLCPGCSSRRSHGSAEALDIPGAMSRYHPPASQVRPTRTRPGWVESATGRATGPLSSLGPMGIPVISAPTSTTTRVVRTVCLPNDGGPGLLARAHGFPAPPSLPRASGPRRHAKHSSHVKDMVLLAGVQQGEAGRRWYDCFRCQEARPMGRCYLYRNSTWIHSRKSSWPGATQVVDPLIKLGAHSPEGSSRLHGPLSQRPDRVPAPNKIINHRFRQARRRPESPTAQASARASPWDRRYGSSL